MKSNSVVGYVPSKLAMQIADDDWAASRQIMPIITEVIVSADDAQESFDDAANVAVVDWNLVELQERTDLIIAPIADIEMAKKFGIPVDDKDKEKDKERDEATVAVGSEDVHPELMKEAADDENNDEMVNVYDRDNLVIEVGKFFPTMAEFRMSFKTYAVKRDFDTKTLWTDTKKFYAKC
jgi:hypothetical protein